MLKLNTIKPYIQNDSNERYLIVHVEFISCTVFNISDSPQSQHNAEYNSFHILALGLINTHWSLDTFVYPTIKVIKLQNPVFKSVKIQTVLLQVLILRVMSMTCC